MNTQTQNIRRIALKWRTEVLGIAPDMLAPAADVLAACDQVTGYSRVALPPDDSLLAGAFAVLDRDAETIWLSANRSASVQAFDAAHEFAHLQLHEMREACSVAELDDGADPNSGAVPAATARVEGYSAQERREVEANIFARELLAPADAVRALYLSGEWDTAANAHRLGVSVRFLRTQVQFVVLSLALSAPDQPDEPGSANPDTPSLADLDDSQREAALLARGPYLLGAGPGTGKTRTLVARCVHLVRDRGVRPDSILALTFSNKAAEEMRERLLSAGIGTQKVGPWIGTFHKFGLELLRKYGHLIGLRPDWRLLDQVGQFLLLENNRDLLALDELSQLANPSIYLRDILKAISRAKDELCSPAQYEKLACAMLEQVSDELKKYRAAARAVELAGAYAVYENLLDEENCVDFGDLVAKTVRILRENPSVRHDLERQYSHVLADEYQDVNRACARLLQLTAGESGAGLWVVGDNRQSIYRFRGASPANITAFTQDFAGATRGELAVNYRSRAEIVRLFELSAQRMSLEGHDDTARTARWKSHRGKQELGIGAPIVYAAADDESAQADGIAASIRNHHTDSGYSYRDQAILCRTHSQAGRLAEQLAERGIPVSYAGKLLSRPEVHDLLAVVAASSGSKKTASIALLRVGMLPEYGLSHNQAASLAKHVAASDEAVPAAIIAFGQADSSADLSALKRLALAVGTLEQTSDPVECIQQYLFEQSRYLQTAIDLQAAPIDFGACIALSAIRQLLSLARSFAIASPSANGFAAKTGFLTQIRRMIRMGDDPLVDLDESGYERDAVRMITAHAAKGLEFPVVYLPNLSAGKFPTPDRSPFIPEPPGLMDDHNAPSTDGSAPPSQRPAFVGADKTAASQATNPRAEAQRMGPLARFGNRAPTGTSAVRDEEQCLFFVALSRAREHLILSRAKVYGKSTRESAPSELLTMIEGALSELGIEETQWIGATEEAPPVAPAPNEHVADNAASQEVATARRAYWMQELEQYQRCPRQYYYTRVLKLGTGDIEPASSIFTAIGETVRWLHSEWIAKRQPGAPEAAEQFDAQWKRLTERTLPDYTRTAAVAMVESVRTSGQLEQLEIAPPNTRLWAELDDARVAVIPDLLATDRTGALVVARNRYGRPQDNDHTHVRLALFRRAAQDTSLEQPATIQLRYLRNGTKRVVPPSARWEPGRIDKYNRAAIRIGKGEFPASPTEEEMCSACPYYFVCPS